MRRNDPGLTGGLAEPSSRRGFPVGTIAIVFFGGLFGYLSSVHGTDMGQKALISGAIWGVIAIFIGFMVTWFFKYVLILAILVIGAMGYTNSPGFRDVTAQARSLKAQACQKITFEFEGVPYKDWMC